MTWQSAGRAIWRYKWLAAALTALLVVLTGLLVSRQTPQYEATSQVRIQQIVPPGDLPAIETAQRNAASYSVVVSGTRFAELVARRLEPRLPGVTSWEVQGSMWAEAVPSTDLLSITARGEDPARITAMVNAAPAALRQFAQLSDGRERIVLTSEASEPTSPVSPRTNLAIAIALVLGLVFNGALMLLLDYLRDRFADAEELQAATGKPVLAVVPRLTNAPRAGARPEPDAASQPAPEAPRTRPGTRPKPETQR